MKKYRVYAVYCGCDFGDEIVDTLEEAENVEKGFIEDCKNSFGEENYYMGNGDFCTYIEEIEV